MMSPEAEKVLDAYCHNPDSKDSHWRHLVAAFRAAANGISLTWSAEEAACYLYQIADELVKHEL